MIQRLDAPACRNADSEGGKRRAAKRFRGRSRQPNARGDDRRDYARNGQVRPSHRPQGRVGLGGNGRRGLSPVANERRRRGRSDVCGGHEPIAFTRDGLDESWGLRGVSQRLPQPPDGRIEAVVKIDKGVVRPQSLAKLVAPDHHPRTLEQRFQQLERLPLQTDARAVADDFAGVEIYVKVSDAHAMRGRGVIGRHSGLRVRHILARRPIAGPHELVTRSEPRPT